MALALDANCVLRWLLADNEAQAAAVAKYLENTNSKLHVADLALAEVAWVLWKVYEFDDDLVVALLRKVIEHDKINCNRALLEPVLNGVGGTPKVSFIDLCLAQYAVLQKAQLLTFDKTLAKRFPKAVELLV